MDTFKIPIRFVISVKNKLYTDSEELRREFDSDVTVDFIFEHLQLLYRTVEKSHLKINVGNANAGESQEDFKDLTPEELQTSIATYRKDKTLEITIEASEGKYLPNFPSPFLSEGYGVGREPKTLVELQMMRLSASIRRKPNWFEKMKDPEITAKWTLEALAQGCTEKQIIYVLEELKYYASIRDPTNGMEVSDVDSVWQSDKLIPRDLQEELLAGVALLENTFPDSKRDWHPGSNNQVWDLVHPSLYPLIYGKSRQHLSELTAKDSLNFCSTGKIIEFQGIVEDYSTSKRFSWIPSEILIGKDGCVQFVSYINNLHPIHHEGLYRTLEKIFSKFIPLLHHVLNNEFTTNRIDSKYTSDWYEGPDSPPESDSDADSQEWQNNRVLNHPIPPEVYVPPKPVEPYISLLGKGLQVIVKLANIMLTPENPEYPGGVWHVEGMKNEQIVASAIYYYDVENISESELAFRQNIQEPHYEQHDERGVRELYGLNDEDPLNQLLGSVVTKKDVCIAFPNSFQHRVKPFKLEDSTKPGHRKILVFFIVNPAIHIPSTAVITPQQKDWYVEALVKSEVFSEQGIPTELVNHIVEFLDWPLTLEKAKALRKELMDERKYFISENNERCFERAFSLCEH